MRNELFDIQLDPQSGTVMQLSAVQDKDGMNWCTESGAWGQIRLFNDHRTGVKESYSPILTSFCESENESRSVYEDETLTVTVERKLVENGRYTERYTIKNIWDTELFFEHGEVGIALPLNDIYTYADECMTGRCNVHLWCGGDVTYINALKMGESDVNLGLMLTKGSIQSYSIDGCYSNHRGLFVLNLGHVELRPEEEYVIEWELFWHKGKQDFSDKLSGFARYIEVKTPSFTVFDDEGIEFLIKTPLACDRVCITCDGEGVPFVRTQQGISVHYNPSRHGEHRFDISIDGVRTYTEFFVAEPIEALIKKRIHFILDKQQYHREGSYLDGAFLIYDNKEKYPVYSSITRDHNATRERTGMALLIARYLRTCPDEAARKALQSYLEFLMREALDVESGEVFDGVRKNAKYKRLYNAPWVTALFTEVYFLTKDKTYLTYIPKMLRHYYSVGGERFYPNGLTMYKTVRAFEAAGMVEEAQELRAMFCTHVDNMVANGLSYPKHEVNFEQTIVSPAATFTSQMAYLTGEKRYQASAGEHIRVLERFGGEQPSFHLHQIPIRYWDGFWFGKARLFGDTFPHYWSCLSARSFAEYYRLTKDEKYQRLARQCIKNCLCLFNDKGEGSCAYVYPFMSNGKQAAFYDEWANDQDFCLYFYLDILDTFDDG